MPLCAVTTTPSPIVRWPATPTCPASVTRSPMRRAARDAHLAGQHAVARRSRPMADLHQVVDLGAAPDARLVQRGAVDRGQRADLDVVLDHHDADLRDLLVAALRVLREAEAVAADHGAVLHDHAVAQAAALAHLHARVQHAVLARPRRRRRATTCGCSTVRAPTRTPGPDHGQRAHVDALAQLRGGVAPRRTGVRPARAGAPGAAATPRARTSGRDCRRAGWAAESRARARRSRAERASWPGCAA